MNTKKTIKKELEQEMKLIENEAIKIIKRFSLKSLKVNTVETINSKDIKTFIIDYNYKD